MHLFSVPILGSLRKHPSLRKISDQILLCVKQHGNAYFYKDIKKYANRKSDRNILVN